MMGFLPDDELGAHLREQVEQGIDQDLRLLAFHAYVGDVTHVAGPLLRMVGHIHTCFEEAKALAGTTEGESNRLHAIIEEAMDLLDKIRAGEQS